MGNKLGQSLIAEFIGTFTLVFVGAFSAIAEPEYGIVVPALAHGLVIVGLIYTYGHISGAHFNPAVTVGLLVTGKIKDTNAAAYVIVQFLGGIVAAYLLVLILPNPGDYGQTIGYLTERDLWLAALLELVLTFFLVSSIYQTAVYGKGGNFAAIAIGFTLTAAILAGSAPSGASLNPARTLGPAMAARDLSYIVPYMVGTFGGGILAGLVNGILLNYENN